MKMMNKFTIGLLMCLCVLNLTLGQNNDDEYDPKIYDMITRAIKEEYPKDQEIHSCMLDYIKENTLHRFYRKALLDDYNQLKKEVSAFFPDARDHCESSISTTTTSTTTTTISNDKTTIPTGSANGPEPSPEPSGGFPTWAIVLIVAIVAVVAAAGGFIVKKKMSSDSQRVPTNDA